MAARWITPPYARPDSQQVLLEAVGELGTKTLDPCGHPSYTWGHSQLRQGPVLEAAVDAHLDMEWRFGDRDVVLLCCP